MSVPAASGEPASCGTTATTSALTLNPTLGNAQPGQQATATVGTRPPREARRACRSRRTGLPSGATASFSPASVTSGGSSTLTISVPAGAASGTYNVTVTGDGASVDRTATFTLTVGAASNVVFSDTFETSLGWTTNASGTDTATSGVWERGDPAATTSAGRPSSSAPPSAGPTVW